MIEVRVYFNKDSRFEPYHAGDRLEEAKISPLLVSPLLVSHFDQNDDPDPLAVCETVFAKLNADNRPNRLYERSLSVGDVVEVNGQLYACEGVGFKPIQQAKDFDWEGEHHE